jgi:hypothetical protein
VTTLVELPLARAVVSRHGAMRGLDLLRRYAEDRVDEEAATMAWEALGSKIERTTVDGSEDVHLQSVFALTPEGPEGPDQLSRMVYWDNEGIVACGRSLPETALADVVGRRMADIVDHPFLRDLTISEAHNHDDDGRIALVVDAGDCMWDIARIEVELA